VATTQRAAIRHGAASPRNYDYVIHDLKRIGVTAGVMFAMIVALYLILG